MTDNTEFSRTGEEKFSLKEQIAPENRPYGMDVEENTAHQNFIENQPQLMTINEMMSIRYKEFNKALTDLACIVDLYASDKKTVKYIKSEYLRIYITYFDVLKHLYELNIEDRSIVPGTSPDWVLFKREVVEPKRVVGPNGKKLHIYVNKDGKYMFIDEIFANGVGLSLDDITFWVENRSKFADMYITADNIPPQFVFFGKAAYVSTKGLRIPKSDNPVAERYYAILGRMYKQIGDILAERKKANAKKEVGGVGIATPSPASASPSAPSTPPKIKITKPLSISKATNPVMDKDDELPQLPKYDDEKEEEEEEIIITN